MPNRNHVWEYVVSVTKHYSGHISGWLPAVVSLGVAVLAAAYINSPSVSMKVVKWTATAYLIVAGLLIFVAQYHAWREQHDRAEFEVAKNQLPHIEGEAFAFDAGPRIGTSGRDSGFRFTQFSCKVFLVNRRQVTTNILKVSLDGSHCKPPISFSGIVHPLNIEVAYAKGTTIEMSGTAEIAGKCADKQRVSMNGLSVVVVDGFRDKHAFGVASEESLEFPLTQALRPDDASTGSQAFCG